jgi:murein DD-endopeptidase MepM/ murein hydrolase activator NlpD
MVPIAIVIIMIAGVRWIIAGGDMGKIKEAKKYISGAVIGLVIAILGSFVLNLVGISDLSLQRLNYIVVQEWDLPDVEIPHVPQNVGGTGSNPPAQPPGGTPPPGGGSVGGKCFPVATGGLGGRGVSWNWGSRRGTAQKIQMPDGSIKNIKVFKRCHAGIDIYTGGNAYVVAIADGKVVNKYNFKACGGTYAVIVNHGSFVVNYGELNLDATYVANGQQVRAGQILGVATTCGMLHFELYNSGTTKNLHWMPGVELPNVSNICRQQYLSSKPAALRDPTETIKALKSNMCSGFR